MNRQRLQSVQILKLFRVCIHIYSVTKALSVQNSSKETLCKLIQKISPKEDALESL